METLYSSWDKDIAELGQDLGNPYVSLRASLLDLNYLRP